MRLVYARRHCVLLHSDGAVHYPFTKFLTDEFDSPHSREAAARPLRLLYRFMNAHCIELAQRALEGRSLTYDEVKKLSRLAYRPLEEIDLLTDRRITLLTSANAEIAPRELAEAVEPNTAQKRLTTIAAYLRFYFKHIIYPHIRQASLRTELQQNYEGVAEQLTSEIAGSKQGHHLTYKSLPCELFLAVMRKVVLEPELVFQTSAGKPSATLWRDRAVVLLACEGVRPGAIGNIARADVYDDGHLLITDHRKRRPGRLSTSAPLLKLGNSVKQHSATETLLKLYPFTLDAIHDYCNLERRVVLSKGLRNRSGGFLFLSDEGGAITDRSTFTKMFSAVGKRLRAMGMLNVSNDPFFHDQIQYDFYGYVLRHSAVDFYFRIKGINDETISSSKNRFGWTKESMTWERYANRIRAEHSSVNLNEFYEQLLVDLASKKRSPV